MTANVNSKVSDSCNNWACCLWCCGSKDDVREAEVAPAPTPEPAALVRSVAMRSLKDVATHGTTEIHFQAVELHVKRTPDNSIHDSE